MKNGGRLFTSGPMPANKQLFYDIIREATGKPIPPMPGVSRYSTEIYAAMQKLFRSVEIHIFENPLTFETRRTVRRLHPRLAGRRPQAVDRAVQRQR